MKLRVLRGREVAELLPMAEALDCMRRAFGQLAAGRVLMPARWRVDAGEGDMLLMPACVPDAGLCLKAVLTYPGNRQRDLPVVQGAILVFDPATGTPQALLDCEELTAIRTGAVGGLAIELLARRDSRVLGLIGAGVQGARQVEAACLVRRIGKVLIYDAQAEAAWAFRDRLAASGDVPEAQVVASPSQLLRQADIVITATTSATPVFDGHELQPGTHVNALGSYRPDRRELDSATVRKAYVVADQREAAMREAGDLIIPGREPDAELAELVAGTAAGRTRDDQITVFKSVGLAVQDAAAAGWVLNKAQQQHVGTLVEF